MTASQQPSAASAKRAADVIRMHLMRYVGPFTAKNAVEMFSKQALGVAADSLTFAQAAAVIDALAPLLRTLLGTQNADRVIEQLKQELAN
ncbi:MAG TPA: hypothetical protein VGK04_11135 [Thermoanaerobaculia bacterium]|jgi:hypothetical protein